MHSKLFVGFDDLNSMLEHFSQKLDVWIPVKYDEKKNVIGFKPYQTGLKPILDKQSTIPPKHILFPQAETLFHFQIKKEDSDHSKKHIEMKEPESIRPALVFGTRPCDVRGFLLFDQVFLNGTYKDPYYAERRQKTLFATIICESPEKTCFCASVGSYPGDQEGSQIMITPVSDGYVLEALTEEANNLLSSWDKNATENQISEASQVQEKVRKLSVDGNDLTQKGKFFKERFSDADFWEEMVSKCLSCGICTFLCPTCHCFNITDDIQQSDGERLRAWDSCMFSHFTLEASGHNPRPTKFERYRNRIGHKFSYIPENFDGKLGCCGCGRCIANCPVSVDIRHIVNSLDNK